MGSFLNLTQVIKARSKASIRALFALIILFYSEEQTLINPFQEQPRIKLSNSRKLPRFISSSRFNIFKVCVSSSMGLLSPMEPKILLIKLKNEFFNHYVILDVQERLKFMFSWGF